MKLTSTAQPNFINQFTTRRCKLATVSLSWTQLRPALRHWFTWHVAVDELRLDGSASVHVYVVQPWRVPFVLVRLTRCLVNSWQRWKRQLALLNRTCEWRKKKTTNPTETDVNASSLVVTSRWKCVSESRDNEVWQSSLRPPHVGLQSKQLNTCQPRTHDGSGRGEGGVLDNALFGNANTPTKRQTHFRPCTRLSAGRGWQ